jgi:DNA-directed RNA polymerase specialized sigma subunit
MKQDELVTSYEQWAQSKSPDAADMLVKQLKPTITSAITAHGFTPDANSFTTAVGHIFDVLPRFDPKKAKLNTFVFNELKRLTRLLPQQTNIVRTPELAYAAVKDLDRTENQLMQELGREPTVDELADASSMSVNKIKKLRRRYGGGTVTTGIELQDRTGFVGEDKGEEDDNFERVWVDTLYNGLSPVDKQIFAWTTGYKGAKIFSKVDIARRLGISPPAITQRANKIAVMLNDRPDFNA